MSCPHWTRSLWTRASTPATSTTITVAFTRGGSSRWRWSHQCFRPPCPARKRVTHASRETECVCVFTSVLSFTFSHFLCAFWLSKEQSNSWGGRTGGGGAGSALRRFVRVTSGFLVSHRQLFRCQRLEKPHTHTHTHTHSGLALVTFLLAASSAADGFSTSTCEKRKEERAEEWKRQGRGAAGSCQPQILGEWSSSIGRPMWQTDWEGFRRAYIPVAAHVRVRGCWWNLSDVVFWNEVTLCPRNESFSNRPATRLRCIMGAWPVIKKICHRFLFSTTEFPASCLVKLLKIFRGFIYWLPAALLILAPSPQHSSPSPLSYLFFFPPLVGSQVIRRLIPTFLLKHKLGEIGNWVWNSG